MEIPIAHSAAHSKLPPRCNFKSCGFTLFLSASAPLKSLFPAVVTTAPLKSLFPPWSPQKSVVQRIVVCGVQQQGFQLILALVICTIKMISTSFLDCQRARVVQWDFHQSPRGWSDDDPSLKSECVHQVGYHPLLCLNLPLLPRFWLGLGIWPISTHSLTLMLRSCTKETWLYTFLNTMKAHKNITKLLVKKLNGTVSNISRLVSSGKGWHFKPLWIVAGLVPVFLQLSLSDHIKCISTWR